MRREKVIGALIGLIGAVYNNGKTDNTDQVIMDAFNCVNEEEAIKLVHQEKNIISPSCASCLAPCGNTSDYDMAQLALQSKEVRELKEQLILKVESIIKENQEKEIMSLPSSVYKAIAYVGYDLDSSYYQKLLEEMNND